MTFMYKLYFSVAVLAHQQQDSFCRQCQPQYKEKTNKQTKNATRLKSPATILKVDSVYEIATSVP